MSIVQRLLSFEGRLRRRDWWLFAILLGLLSWALSSVAMGLMGVSMMSLLPTANGQADASGAMLKVIAVQCVAFLVFLWPGLAIGFKRLHDRDKSGRMLVLLYVLSAANQLVSVLGAQSGIAGMMHPGLLRLCLSLVLLVVGVWMLIELGFLDGTQGPNKFGPSPKGIGTEFEVV